MSLKNIWDYKGPDTPSREGLSKKVLKKILEHTPDHLIYISCMPPTLIRDLTVLQQHYEIGYAKGYDLFPQTTHLETFTYLRKK